MRVCVVGGCMAKKPQWTDSEMDILKQNYLAKTLEDLLKLLPSRTEYSIKKKAVRLCLLKKMQTRKLNGTFQRLLKPFSLDNFNDGWVDSDGRFRVYFPNHYRADKNGHILRAIVAYEAYHRIIIPIGKDVHHKDGDRLNDSKENLELLIHDEHSHISNPILNIVRTCKNCGKKFNIKPWRLRQPQRGNFCSRKCSLTFYRRILQCAC